MSSKSRVTRYILYTEQAQQPDVTENAKFDFQANFFIKGHTYEHKELRLTDTTSFEHRSGCPYYHEIMKYLRYINHEN